MQGKAALKERQEEQSAIWLTERAWKDQKLIAAELRRQREAAGMTQEQLAEKMGAPYTAEVISQYESGEEIPMEMWTVFDMVQALQIDMSDVAPKNLLARQCTESGYAELDEESRQIVDGVIRAVLRGQRSNP